MSNLDEEIIYWRRVIKQEQAIEEDSFSKEFTLFCMGFYAVTTLINSLAGDS